MKNPLAKIIVFAAAMSLLVSVFGQSLTIKGSDTLLGLSQKWAEAYKAQHPEAVIQVAGGGAAAAFAALADKKLDIVLVSRSIRYKEADSCVSGFGQRPPEYKVAVSGLAVYVNVSNSVTTLTYDELFSIYSGQRKNWKEFDGGETMDISVYTQATNSIHGELFNEEVLAGKVTSIETTQLPNPDLLKAIASDPKGIGYGALTQFDGVRPVSIKRVFSSKPMLPSETTITNRTYPISRFVYCYVSPTANQAEAKAYLDWIRSDAGQQIAKKAGFFPTAAKWRTTP
jgi:phosphate transport system substrate-binding protein